MSFIRFGYKAIKKIIRYLSGFFYWSITWFKFTINGVKFPLNFYPNGYPVLKVDLKGSIKIGNYFRFHSGNFHNMIGRQQFCYFIVGPEALLEIGNNVGISTTAFVCHNHISVGDNVKIGGNTVIYDTDFHSLKVSERTKEPEDFSKVNTKPVTIGNNAFIGAHSTILKGVNIGENSIIGAGSVVSKDIPSNEVWAGNPAKFIRKVENE